MISFNFFLKMSTVSKAKKFTFEKHWLKIVFVFLLFAFSAALAQSVVHKLFYTDLFC